MNVCESIDRHRETLLYSLDSNDYTIACLAAEKVFTEKEIERINSKQSIFERNLIILHFLRRSSSESLARFAEVLRTSRHNEQTHIANLLENNNENNNNNGKGQLPLVLERIKTLESLKPNLKHTIHQHEKLVDILIDKKAITNVDKLSILSDKLEIIRNQKVLETIARRTEYSFESLREALIETDQPYCAEYLTEGEILVIYVKISRPDLNGRIVESISSALVDPQQRSALSIGLESHNLSIVGSSEGKENKNIIVYIYCPSIIEMNKLVKLHFRGMLENIIEKIINRLLVKLEVAYEQNLKAEVDFQVTKQILVRSVFGVLLNLYEYHEGIAKPSTKRVLFSTTSQEIYPDWGGRENGKASYDESRPKESTTCFIL